MHEGNKTARIHVSRFFIYISNVHINIITLPTVTQNQTAPSSTIYTPPQNHETPSLLIPTSEPNRRLRNILLPTRKLIDTRLQILTTHPRPAPIRILLDGLPLKRRPSLHLHITAHPNTPVIAPLPLPAIVLLGAQRHRAAEIPLAQRRDAADDVDAFAPLRTELDGEGERDGRGVRACGRGRGDGDAEAGAARRGFAVAAGVDFVGVLEGVDRAVVGEVRRGVAYVGGRVEGCGGDDLGGVGVAGGIS